MTVAIDDASSIKRDPAFERRTFEELVSTLDRQAPLLRERPHRVHAAHRRTGHDSLDPSVDEHAERGPWPGGARTPTEVGHDRRPSTPRGRPPSRDERGTRGRPHATSRRTPPDRARTSGQSRASARSNHLASSTSPVGRRSESFERLHGPVPDGLGPPEVVHVRRCRQLGVDPNPEPRLLADLTDRGLLERRLTFVQLPLRERPVVVSRPVHEGELAPRRPRRAGRPRLLRARRSSRPEALLPLETTPRLRPHLFRARSREAASSSASRPAVNATAGSPASIARSASQAMATTES